MKEQLELQYIYDTCLLKQVEFPFMGEVSKNIDWTLSWRRDMKKDLEKITYLVNEDEFVVPGFEKITNCLVKYSDLEIEPIFIEELNKITKGTIFNFDITILKSLKKDFSN